MPENPEIQIKRMWDGGPLRQWSPDNPTRNFMSYGKGGYVGSYVCDFCQNTCDGLYRVKNSDSWTCGSCRKQRKVPHPRTK
jgi:hypothetical protein